jgi:hypothetical protein
MDIQDVDSLIAQTAALSWEDPSSQLETLPQELIPSEVLPLVGKIISQKTQHNQTVHAALVKAWFFANPFSFAVLGPNLFLFKFSDQSHISRILSNVWNVNGSLLAIQVWKPSATIMDLPLFEVPFWIQIHGLPLQNMTIKNAIAIGKGLGQFMKVEDNSGETMAFRSYLKVLVSIDVHKPLIFGFNFNRGDGSHCWVGLKYERLDVYCTDCGKIGHHQTSCLARLVEKHPNRYQISLKVNVFSNLPVSMSAASATVNHQESVISLGLNSNTPCFPSLTPKENQQNICTSSKNPLSKPSPALWSQPPKSVTTPPQDLPCTTYTLAVTMEKTIEHTLNALSLFHNPIQLFSNTTSPSTSQSIPNPSSKLNQLDPHQEKPSTIGQIKPISPIDTSPTTNNHSITPNTTENTCLSAKITAERTPYNTRHTKKPIISIQDRPPLSNPTTSISPYCNENKKRPCPTDFLSPTRKSPGAVADIAEPPNSAPSNFLTYSPGSMELKPARALFKAARKGKSKIGPAVNEPIVATKKKGGCAKPPQIQ